MGRKAIHSLWIGFLAVAASAIPAHAQDIGSILRGASQVWSATKSKQEQSQQPAQTPSGSASAVGHYTTEISTNQQQIAASPPPPGAAPSDLGDLNAQPAPPVASRPPQRPMDEGGAVYDKARSEGSSDESAWILEQLTAFNRQLHEAASGSNHLAFKNLTLGADFPISIAGTPLTSTHGRDVEFWEDGPAPTLNLNRPSEGPTERWRCWSGEEWGMAVACLLVESPSLTTAFGQSLTSVRVQLSKPEYDYQPTKYPWQRDLHPRIVMISLEADGDQLAKAANEYAKRKMHTSPKITRPGSANGTTPSRSTCAAVNGKRIRDLTGEDVQLRRACSSPTSGLLQSLDSPTTIYDYEDAKDHVSVTETHLIDGSTSSKMDIMSVEFLKLAEKRPQLVQSLRAQYETQKAKAGQRDF